MYDEKEFDPDPFDVELKWIDGACYRIYKRNIGSGDDIPEHKKIKPYTEYDGII